GGSVPDEHRPDSRKGESDWRAGTGASLRTVTIRAVARHSGDYCKIGRYTGDWCMDSARCSQARFGGSGRVPAFRPRPPTRAFKCRGASLLKGRGRAIPAVAALARLCCNAFVGQFHLTLARASPGHRRRGDLCDCGEVGKKFEPGVLALFRVELQAAYR